MKLGAASAVCALNSPESPLSPLVTSCTTSALSLQPSGGFQRQRCASHRPARPRRRRRLAHNRLARDVIVRFLFSSAPLSPYNSSLGPLVFTTSFLTFRLLEGYALWPRLPDNPNPRARAGCPTPLLGLSSLSCSAAPARFSDTVVLLSYEQASIRLDRRTGLPHVLPWHEQRPPARRTPTTCGRNLPAIGGTHQRCTTDRSSPGSRSAAAGRSDGTCILRSFSLTPPVAGAYASESQSRIHVRGYVDAWLFRVTHARTSGCLTGSESLSVY